MHLFKASLLVALLFLGHAEQGEQIHFPFGDWGSARPAIPSARRLFEFVVHRESDQPVPSERWRTAGLVGSVQSMPGEGDS